MSGSRGLQVSYAGIDSAVSSLGTAATQVENCHSVIQAQSNPDAGPASVDAAIADYVTDVLNYAAAIATSITALQSSTSDAVMRYTGADSGLSVKVGNGQVRAE